MSSKALVLKGTNFSINKVTTVTVTEIVPCTGLTIDKSTISFTTLGSTSTITATKTPVNTTDTVTWHTSNSSVATVVGGVVTCVGIGSATITAVCGTKTQTCSVTSAIIIDLTNNAYGRDNTCHTSKNSERDYLSLTASNYAMTFYDKTNEMNGYKAASASFTPATEWETRYPIPMPLGAGHVKLTFPKAIGGSARVAFLNANAMTTYGAGLTSAKCFEHFNSQTLVTGTDSKTCTIDISSVSSEANSFIVSFTLGTSSYTADTVTGDFTIEFGA